MEQLEANCKLDKEELNEGSIEVWGRLAGSNPQNYLEVPQPFIPAA